MPFGKGRRKLLLGCGILLLFLGVLWFCAPVWFPWVLRPLAFRAGARYDSYERVGYSRFVIHGVSLTNGSTIVQAGSVEAFVPTVWLWKLAAGSGPASDTFLSVRDWSCRLVPSNKPAKAPFSQLQDLASTLRTIQRWIPHAVLAGGFVDSDELKISVRQATWKLGVLQAQLAVPVQGASREIAVSLGPARPFNAQLSCLGLGLDSKFVLSTNQAGFDLRNLSVWQSNRFEVQAHFDAHHMLPQTASLQATNLLIPATLLKLPHYDSLSGSVSGRWNEGQFAIELSATARPAIAETDWPQAQVNFQARGTTNFVTVEKLAVSSPFLRASVSNEFTVSFSEPFIRSPARLNLTADLSQQHWVPLSGQVTGRADIAAGTGRFPTGQVEVVGKEVGDSSLKAGSVNISAKLDWPNVQLVEARARFEDGSVASLTGQVDLEKKRISNGTVHLDGPLLRRWLPPSSSFQTFSFAGNFHGPFEHLSHSGQVVVSGIDLPQVKPLALKFLWDGEAKAVKQFSLQISSPEAGLQAGGSLNLATNQSELKLAALTVRTNGQTALRLAQPLQIQYTGKTNTTGWGLVASPFRMVGPAGELNAQASVRWPNQGTLQMSIKDFPMTILAAFARSNLPPIEVARVETSAEWSNSPVTMQLEGLVAGSLVSPRSSEAAAIRREVSGTGSQTATEALPAQLLSTRLKLELNLAGDAHGLVLSNLVVSGPTSVVAVAHGFAPLSM